MISNSSRVLSGTRHPVAVDDVPSVPFPAKVRAKSMRDSVTANLTALSVAVSMAVWTAAAQGDANGTRTDFPVACAFNLGAYVAQVLKDAQKERIADAINVSAGHSEVRHIWIQVFENSKVAAVEQTTLFVIATSYFHSSLNQSLLLEKVRLEFVVLNANGKPTGDTTEVVEIKTDYDPNAKLWSWERKPLNGRSLKDFHSSIPDWARLKLHQASGFLSKNPGMPLVAYAPTDLELIFELADMAVSLPRFAKTPIGKAVEAVVRKVAKGGLSILKKTFDDDELHIGADRDITNERAVKYADEYKKQGASIWQQLGK